MCYFPKLILNKKYRANKKNGGNIPILKDERTKYVAVGCGNCEQCRKQKGREWQVRITEELKEGKKCYFVTLTFSNERLLHHMKKYNAIEGNALAKIAVRKFLERWRKEFKKSVRHWFITELGHENTERIHLHGLIWTDEEPTNIEKHWKNGFVYIGDYVNAKTINYIIKYVSKIDGDHKDYKPIVLCSSGIGARWANSYNTHINKYDGKNTDEAYRLSNGRTVSLPIYYRNKIYSEDEKENLWINKLDSNIRYVNGTKYYCNDEKQQEEFLKALEHKQLENKQKGYGDDSNEWKKSNYNVTLNMLKRAKKEKEYTKWSTLRKFN